MLYFLALMGLDNVDVATSILQRMKYQRMQYLRNQQRSEITATLPTIKIHRSRYRNRLRHPSRMRPSMIADILRLIDE